jgi:transposase-like protein
MGRLRKRRSAAFKAKAALEAVKQQKTVSELAKEHQVHPAQISHWKKQLLGGLEGLFGPGSAGRRPRSRQAPGRALRADRRAPSEAGLG